MCLAHPFTYLRTFSSSNSYHNKGKKKITRTFIFHCNLKLADHLALGTQTGMNKMQIFNYSHQAFKAHNCQCTLQGCVLSAFVQRFSLYTDRAHFLLQENRVKLSYPIKRFFFVVFKAGGDQEE